MKKIFVAAMAALTLLSCSKENNNETNPEGKPATISLSITGSGNKTKATGVTTGDVSVNNLNVFIFDNTGKLVVAPIYIASPVISPAVNTVSATTAATEVYVVANVGSAMTGIGGKTALLTAVGDLVNAGASTQSASNVYMEGTGTITWVGTTGSAQTPLDFVGSKIEVEVDLTQFKNPAGANHITMNEVVLLFAGKEAKYFAAAADKAIQTNFYSGDASYPTPSTSTPATFLAQSLTFDAGTTDFPDGAMATDNPHFYTFANNGAATPTILALKGTRGGTTYYWPIQFTAADAGHTVVAGNSYTVRFTLKGDTSGGGSGGGTEDPEEPIIPASLTIEVTPAAWTPNIINKDFN